MLALQLAEGGELFDFMMYTGHFAEPVARTLFRQLLSALQVRKYNGFGGLCFASSVHSVCVASVGPPGTIIILIWGVVWVCPSFV